jgi:hypothetical protein
MKRAPYRPQHQDARDGQQQSLHDYAHAPRPLSLAQRTSVLLGSGRSSANAHKTSAASLRARGQPKNEDRNAHSLIVGKSSLNSSMNRSSHRRAAALGNGSPFLVSGCILIVSTVCIPSVGRVRECYQHSPGHFFI